MRLHYRILVNLRTHSNQLQGEKKKNKREGSIEEGRSREKSKQMSKNSVHQLRAFSFDLVSNVTALDQKSSTSTSDFQPSWLHSRS